MARRRTRVNDDDPCPCTSGATYGACCEPILAGGPAPTAEALMRSRFTAFAVGDAAHLLRSWHPDTRPPAIEIEADRRWTRLEIVETEAGRALDGTGIVAFVAHYDTPTGLGSLAERSRFARVDGAWVYVDGDVSA